MAPSATQTVTATVDNVANGVGKVNVNGKVASKDVRFPPLIKSPGRLKLAVISFICRKGHPTLCTTRTLM